MQKKKKIAGKEKRGLSRRKFIGGSIAAIAGTGLQGSKSLFSSESNPGEGDLRIKEYRTLGRTGFRVSDIGFGSGELADGALLEAILDSGVNYIDSAENYGRGRSERVIGSVIKKRDRKKVFITTKLGVRKDDTKESIIKRAEKCLERLQTDYIDCLMTHMPATVEDLRNKVFLDAVKELKSRDKVRFCGVSNHGSQWNDVPETMDKVLQAAAEDGRFDVMLFVYNFLQQEQGEKVLKACKENNVGATLMKTNPVLNYFEMKENAEKAEAEGREVPGYLKNLLPRLKERADRAEAFKEKYKLTSYDAVRNAAVRFVLSNPDVSCACMTIKNFIDLDFYTGLSGKRFGVIEKQALTDYSMIMDDLYCRHACGVCESECPEQVPVNTIMRYNYYFTTQGREKSAMQKYASLPLSRADLCKDCAGYCEKACPFGVPVQGLLGLAHQTLTLI